MSETRDHFNCDSKTPKRILYFSDGVLEESDSDGEDRDLRDSNGVQSDKQMILKDWPMISVVVSTVLWLGSKSLNVCDIIGENLANFFGITSPKYEYEIEEYNRRVEEQNKLESKLKSEFEGWTQSDSSQSDVQLKEVKSN